MEHKLTPELQISESSKNFISVFEINDGTCTLCITRQPFNDELEQIVLCSSLNQKELHSFIGTLLHVQQKIKGGK